MMASQLVASFPGSFPVGGVRVLSFGSTEVIGASDDFNPPCDSLRKPVKAKYVDPANREWTIAIATSLWVEAGDIKGENRTVQVWVRTA